MGTIVVAANSINNMVNQFATLFMYGLASASSVIIGNTIGEGNTNKVKEYANTIALLSVFMGILAAIIIYILRPIAINFYNVADVTKDIARDIMIATAIVSIFRSLSANILTGILRGGGDNKFVFIVEMTCLWCVAIPLGFIGSFVWKLPIVVVFLIIRSDEVLKSIIGLIRLASGKWINDITR
jgi:Na+-driven multidrug efflux pump